MAMAGSASSLLQPEGPGLTGARDLHERPRSLSPVRGREKLRPSEEGQGQGKDWWVTAKGEERCSIPGGVWAGAESCGQCCGQQGLPLRNDVRKPFFENYHPSSLPDAAGR